MMTKWIYNIITKLGIKLIGAYRWRLLSNACDNPYGSQHNTLREIMAANRETTFGKEHAFAKIHSIEEYKSCVPIQTYETLRNHIIKQRDTGERALTQAAPVLYAQTSGTTGEPKYIPLTEGALADYKKQQQVVTYHFYKTCPQAFDGKVLAIVSPAVEGHFESGVPFGSASGCIHDAMPRFVRERYVVPPCVFGFADYDVKYHIILLLALAEADITYIACANPSTLVRLLAMVNNNLADYIESIRTGSISFADKPGATNQSHLSESFKANPARADQLSALIDKQPVSLLELWPKLKLITTWTSGSCGLALSNLRNHIPRHVHIIDIGYLASEMRATITTDSITQSGVPILTDHFYEFAEVQAWDNGDQSTKLLHDLLLGKDYYLIITTQSGLYRYFMNDIVTVTEFHRNAPMLKFVQKGKGVTNITGEKVYEAQLLNAVREVLHKREIQTAFIIGLADRHSNQYQVFIESAAKPTISTRDLAEQVDHTLGNINIEYKTKRASGRLLPLDVYWLTSGTYEAFKTFHLQRGQREGQFKFVALQYKDEFTFSFSQFICY